ncbi:hypothetical protein JB92DRAFT_3096775 [Gautieria morchelliformis]|nr:hypothetical protein JB92DRAFT_3096775 [Gautieria morchelliformis]
MYDLRNIALTMAQIVVVIFIVTEVRIESRSCHGAHFDLGKTGCRTALTAFCKDNTVKSQNGLADDGLENRSLRARQPVTITGQCAMADRVVDAVNVRYELAGMGLEVGRDYLS